MDAVKYGLGVLGVCAKYRLHRWGLRRFPIFEPEGRRLSRGSSPIARDPSAADG